MFSIFFEKIICRKEKSFFFLLISIFLTELFNHFFFLYSRLNSQERICKNETVNTESLRIE